MGDPILPLPVSLFEESYASPRCCAISLTDHHEWWERPTLERSAEMTTGRGVIRRPSLGEAMRILLGEHDSDGALGVVEMALAPGATGPPLHVHPTHAEAFYVLAGDLSLQVGDEVVTGGLGTWACAPRNVPHTLANFGSDEGRLLCLFAPAGFERCFERMLNKDSGLVAELSEAERETRLIGPPLAARTEPAKPNE
jgi:quercetin dioxygenase-like cupin family protein